MGARPWVTEAVRRTGAVFAEVHYPEAYTAQQLAHREHVSGHRVAKVVVVYADGKPTMLVLPASHRVNFDRLREALKAKEISLASESEVAGLFPDCETGAEPPLRHGGLEMLMDREMRVDGDILFNAGTHEDGIMMPFAAWFGLAHPRVEAFAVEPGRMPPRPAGEED
ncbi:MAG: YbaK/EbsC family protein [Elusimicrobia bacterium]|nr:YbaK/EbsC family protein [Elusimicrobiota bacterium]